MSDVGLYASCFSEINNSQLDEVVGEIAARLPMCGIRTIQSMPKADGIILQRERVREALCIVLILLELKEGYRELFTIGIALCLAPTPSGTSMAITSSFGGDWLCMGVLMDIAEFQYT